MKSKDRRELRLYGKELYIVYPKLGIEGGNFKVEGYTNKRQVSGRFNLKYDNLVRVFTRNRRTYYEFEEAIVMKLYLSDITKGGQSFARKGRGGRDQFDKFIRNR